MKKRELLGYILMVIIGVLSVFALMLNNERINEQQEKAQVQKKY